VVVSDEASNFKLARNFITQQPESKHVLEYRCLVHVFNLVGASVTEDPSVKIYTDQVLDIIDMISRTKPLAAAIVEAGGGRVVRPVPTRWFSTCAAINSVLRIKPGLASMPDWPEFGMSRFDPLLEDSILWDALDHLKTYFDGLSKIIGIAKCYDSNLSVAFRSFLEFGHTIFRKLPLSRDFIEG